MLIKVFKGIDADVITSQVNEFTKAEKIKEFELDTALNDGELAITIVYSHREEETA